MGDKLRFSVKATGFPGDSATRRLGGHAEMYGWVRLGVTRFYAGWEFAKRIWTLKGRPPGWALHPRATKKDKVDMPVLGCVRL